MKTLNGIELVRHISVRHILIRLNERIVNFVLNWGLEVNDMFSSIILSYFGHLKRHDSLERHIFETRLEGKRRKRPTNKKMD